VSDCAIVSEKEGVTTVTLVNPSYSENRKFSFENSAKIRQSKLYNGKSLMPHHTFEIETLDVIEKANEYEVNVPPHSLAIVQF
jgi:hypothetical protein